ncbi:MAG: hypothetical protein QM715_08230 [Nibricoccus sp.]
MHLLSNNSLQLEVLDPASASEQRHQGMRFSHGGYIWQVRDARDQTMFVGPEWPNPFPDSYNGQGLPESFSLKPYPEDQPSCASDKILIPGAGITSAATGKRNAVDTPCKWEMVRNDTALEFRTAHTAGPLNMLFQRSIELQEQTIISKSLITNTGDIAFVITWFAHPFLPLSNGFAQGQLQPGYAMKDNSDFTIDSGHMFSMQRPFLKAGDNHLEWLQIEANSDFEAIVAHPHTKQIRINTNFIPDRCAVWANSKTWSIEPYTIRTIQPGYRDTWFITYKLDFDR